MSNEDMSSILSSFLKKEEGVQKEKLSKAAGFKTETQPIPPGTRGKSAELVTMESMEVGESFLYPCPDEEKAKAMTRISIKKRRVEKRSDRRFTTRKVDGGVRVWRTA